MKLCKKLSVFIFVVLFVLNTSFVMLAAENTYYFSEISDKYKTQGRTQINSEGVVLDWSASGIEFIANCSGNVTLDIVPRYSTKTGNTGGMYFTVLVDGVMQASEKRTPANTDASSWTSNSTNYPYYLPDNNAKSFLIASNLPAGSHRFEIYKQGEAEESSFAIKSIRLDGTIESAPAKRDFLIEFVGDSIVAGLGNLSKGGNNAPLYQDATQGFAYLTAKSLDSDWSIIARSGITASNNMGWSGTSSVSMQSLYPMTEYYSDNSANYDFQRQPNVIVVSLGTNDINTYKSSGKTLDDVKTGFSNILALLKQKNPNAKIVWLYGMMTDAADSLIKEAVENAGGSGQGIYTLAMPKNTSGGQGHPDLSAQKVYAAKTAEYIGKLFGRTVLKENTNEQQDNTTSNQTNSSSNNSNDGNQKENNSNSNSDYSDDGTDSDFSFSDDDIDDTENPILESLSVKDYKITPSFDPDVKEYSLALPNSVTEIQVNFVPGLLFKSCQIKGSTNIPKYKSSKVTIDCYDTKGNKTIYIIKILRQKSSIFSLKTILIVGGAVIVLAVATIVVIIFVRKKRNKNVKAE